MESNRRSTKLILGYLAMGLLAVIGQTYLSLSGHDLIQASLEIPVLEASGMNSTFDVVRGALGLIEGLLNYIF
jgi:hypothetical protein